MRILKSVVHRFGRWYINEVNKREYESQKFRCINERPIEFGFVFRSLSRIMPTTVIDVGTGTTSLPHLMAKCGFLVTAIDNVYDYWPKGMHNRHFYIINEDITHIRSLAKRFDFITCVSVLEHIPIPEVAIQSMFTLLNPGGHLVLTFPYNENKHIENVYKLQGAGYGQNAPYICQVYSRKEVDRWLRTNNGEIVEQEYWQIFTGDFWTFGERLYPPRQVDKDAKHQLTCILIQKNDNS